mmetsp:Transcript_34395/g.81097  ORF Transcript_34395/g.81097 Transcript_34395/m.81097 type:complete len:308 (-) Transcript_34395:47-970(-)
MSQRSDPPEMPSSMDTEQAGAAAPLRMKRCVTVQISGTMNNFAQAGPTAATWKPLEGKHVDVFGVHDHEGICLDHGTMTNAMRNAVVLKATILKQSSTFPVPLGVSMNCITPCEVTDMGEKYVTTVLPNSVNTAPQVVYETDAASADSIEWRAKYPNFNASNLETNGILPVNGFNYVFVHQDHPVIALLRVNKDLLGADIDEQHLIDGQWYKVSRQVLTSCCNTLRTKVLSRIATRDLNTFSVQLHRLGNDNWADLGDGAEFLQDMPQDISWDASQRQAAEAKWMELQLKKPCTFIASVLLEYEVQP